MFPNLLRSALCRLGFPIRRWVTIALALAPALADAQTQFQGVCAQAKIEILQELTFERIGFEATLEITNNLGNEPVTDFSASLTFSDPNDLVNGEPRDVTDRFFVQRPRLTDINSVEGTGIIGPTKTAIIRWFIIPKPEAGGSNPLGKRYEVGVSMAGKLGGVELPASVLLAIPDTIVVRPEPQLDINYFQPRDVQGDDPFTQEVEAPIPFTLGVLVKNSGFGTAKNLQIKSQQPKIVENTAGLLLVARLLGSRVQDAPLNESSLTVNLGDIGPGVTRKGAWDMITSLSGTFTEFKASYTHRDDLGGEATSLIKSLGAHFIAHEGINDDPGRDSILDFIADVDRDDNFIPDTLYESQGQILPINHSADASVSTPLANNVFGLTVNGIAEGWNYIRISDPGQAKLGFASVVRSDGRIVNLRNVWTNIRYDRATNEKLTFFNLLDKYPRPGVYTYTVTYLPPPPDTLAPVTRLRFSGEMTESGGAFYVTRGTQMYFTSEDASPVSIQYRINGGQLRPGLPFRLTEPGDYTIQYFATDSAGNIEAPRIAVLVLQGAGPTIASASASGEALALTEDVLTYRPDSVEFDVEVGANPVQTDAEVSVFRGIRAWPTLSGVPVSPTPSTTASLTVGGELVDFYRYRVNGGAWSAERPVSQPFALSSLSGEVTLQVVGRSQHSAFPPDNQALTAVWTVSPSAPSWSIAGLPATPTRFQISPLSVSGPGLELYRWRHNGSFFRAEEPPATAILVPTQVPGNQLLDLIGRRGGVWQAENAPSRWAWTYDPAYGSDFSSLALVRSATFNSVQGTTFSYSWDGRDGAGVPQPPGYYTLRIRVTDALGNFTFRNLLVRIDDVTSAPAVIASATVGPERPHAAGDWLVWQERGSGAPNIRALRVSTGTTRDVTATSLAQSNPRTDGRYVVWQALRPDGSSDILLTDLSTVGAEVNLSNTPTVNEVNPSIDWPWVVWQSRPTAIPDAPWQVQAYNLVTSQLVGANPSTQDQLDPVVQGGRVVWQDFRDVGFGEIYFRDLETGENRRITTNGFGQYKPSIHGDWIVWQDNRHTQVEIYGMNLLRGAEQRLTNSSFNEADPQVRFGRVLYSDDALGTLTVNFRLLDLATLRSVPLTRSNSAKSFGALSGNKLFWQSGTIGSSQILTADIPALQPVFRNLSAVALTPDLVAAYPNAEALLNAWNAAAGVVGLSRFASFNPLVEQSLTTTGGVVSGTNFPLVSGETIWVRFPAGNVVDLGFTLSETVDLPAGVSVFNYAMFPEGFTGHRLAESLGLANVRGLRVLDSESGLWRVLEISGGAITGADFAVPPVGVVLVDLTSALNDWKP